MSKISLLRHKKRFYLVFPKKDFDEQFYKKNYQLVYDSLK